MKLFAALPFLLCSTLALNAFAQSSSAIKITDPWARATVGSQKSSGAFMQIENTGKEDDVLLWATTNEARNTELHTMKMQDGIMTMTAIKRLAIPAGKTTVLASGGHHIMFFDLKHPLKAQEKFQLTLVFEKAGSVKVQVQVQPVTFDPKKPEMEGMKH